MSKLLTLKLGNGKCFRFERGLPGAFPLGVFGGPAAAGTLVESYGGLGDRSSTGQGGADRRRAVQRQESSGPGLGDALTSLLTYLISRKIMSQLIPTAGQIRSGIR